MRFWMMVIVSFGALHVMATELEINSAQRLLQQTGYGATVPIGERVDALAFDDSLGQTHRLGQGHSAAMVFLSVSCPLAKRYTQRLNRLHDHFAKEGVRLFGVFPNLEDSSEAVASHAREMSFAFPTVKDTSGYLARRLGARMTPQVVVVDGEGVIRYRGAIDDNRYENRVKHPYLRDVLTAIGSGAPIAQSETKALGCSIHLAKLSDVGVVNYTQHVARILQDNCQSCHRPGQVAPFSLTNYQEAKTWATEINAYAQARLMPPWKAAAGFGRFQHERRLTDEQLQLIDRWVAGGTPLGPASDMPPAPHFNDGWELGAPDHVFEMPEEYTIGAEGEDDYRHFIIPTNFDRDIYVRAAEFVPGNRQSVHHVIAFVDTSGKARELDAADPGPGYTRFGDVGFEPVSGLGGWAPGSQPDRTAKGTGFFLPKGADVVLQVHYYRTGRVEKDRTKVGIYFCDEPNPVAIDVGVAINHQFTIPAEETHYRVEATWKVEEPIYAFWVAPHMHLLGKEMKVTATLPDGHMEPLIWIKEWDFNWQDAYRFEKPLLFPKGTKVDLVAYFDNSNENVNNPHDPPQPVSFGEKTTDEMCIAFVSFVKADQWQPRE